MELVPLLRFPSTCPWARSAWRHRAKMLGCGIRRKQSLGLQTSLTWRPQQEIKGTVPVVASELRGPGAAVEAAVWVPDLPAPGEASSQVCLKCLARNCQPLLLFIHPFLPSS